VSDREPLILALDQGTTSSRAIAFDRAGRIAATAQREFEQRYPSPGHVTHDPEAIWESQIGVARDVIATVGGPQRIAAIGIANQRETTIVWDRATGRPVADAIVWQSRITAAFCDRLKADGHEDLIRSRTGLPIDAYFAGPKIRHILDSDRDLGVRAERGELAFGTVDSFLIWRLTGGRVHITDVSNASRTMIFDIHRLDWDDELLALMGVPRAMLPEVRASSEIYGSTDPALFGSALPIAAAAGDQQAATFGQACFRLGQAKNTYGTGAFLLRNTGLTAVPSRNGLITTIGWRLGPDAPVTYALEGSVFVAGAAVQWLRDGLHAITSSAEVETLASGAQAAEDGVFFVPAFVGLGAPYWDPYARGTLVGLSRGTGLAEIARATIESIAFGVRDVLDAMDADLAAASAGASAAEVPAAPSALRVDGGAAVNDSLLQFQADILGTAVERPRVAETTALGAAYLAGLAVDFWRDPDELESNWALERRFEPGMDSELRDRLYRGWQRAVERARGWVEP
jgi:glycerol kinase